MRRIIRDCNDELLEKAKGSTVTLLPPFSCHNLRHTFATRMCEAGVNVKAVQVLLGHADIGITMNVYTDATGGFVQQELGKFENYLNLSGENKRDGSDDLVIPVTVGSSHSATNFRRTDCSCKTNEKSI